ncbi:MAG: hypothetical protein GEV03_23440 [Streptosporangiales bacterium]|nr:hypothetical protein [Streptosporangiales bacterium]
MRRTAGNGPSAGRVGQETAGGLLARTEPYALAGHSASLRVTLHEGLVPVTMWRMFSWPIGSSQNRVLLAAIIGVFKGRVMVSRATDGALEPAPYRAGAQ